MHKIKKFSSTEGAGKFFSVVSLDSFADSENIDSIDIEMLRVGTFKHKKYGDLEITEEMLSTMIENFNNKVVGRDISFDWNHKAEDASGWLKGLKVEDGVLIGTTELTAKGCKDIKAKKYGYFSIEYTDDFSDPESGEVYGPTILGGALTNRPFMTKLKKIEFESDDSNDSIYRYEEEKKMDKVVDRTPVKLTDEEKITKLTEKNDELEKQIKELSVLPDTMKKMNELIEAQKTLTAEQSAQIKTLQDQNKSFKETSDASVKKAHSIEVERMCDKLMKDDNHHPAVVAIAREILMSAPADKIVKLTEKVGEKEVVMDYSISEAVQKLLSSIPASQRANYDEKTRIGDDKTLTEEEQDKIEDSAIKKSLAKKGLKLAVVK